MVRCLLALLPAAATAGLYPDRLRPLRTAHVGNGPRRRTADMAWAVAAPTPEHPSAEVFLALEFQSTRDRRMALRMLVYVGLLWQEAAVRGRLPPVLPVVVYTGRRPWQAQPLAGLMAPAAAGLLAYQPVLNPVTIDAATLTEEVGEGNPAAALLRLLQCDAMAEVPALAQTLFTGLRRRGWHGLASRLAEALMRRFRTLLAGDLGERQEQQLQQALRYMEDATMLERNVARWRRQALAEGRAEGRVEGRAEGRAAGFREVLARVAARRFGAPAGTELASLMATEANEERLGQMGDLVVECHSASNCLIAAGPCSATAAKAVEPPPVDKSVRLGGCLPHRIPVPHAARWRTKRTAGTGTATGAALHGGRDDVGTKRRPLAASSAGRRAGRGIPRSLGAPRGAAVRCAGWHRAGFLDGDRGQRAPASADERPRSGVRHGSATA